uniref:Uncharacterized protein n=1 Tax=Glossina austeni TaxID=7395 RepID=A0A1A9UDV7_GLOAU
MFHSYKCASMAFTPKSVERLLDNDDHESPHLLRSEKEFRINQTVNLFNGSNTSLTNGTILSHWLQNRLQITKTSQILIQLLACFCAALVVDVAALPYLPSVPQLSK